jgi:peptidoglycan/xylan/chitin deacetylase (PgdA/CDA1 family)
MKIANGNYGKMRKFITFSFDDAVTQDVRTIAILDKYGLKGTFNLNSDLLGIESSIVRNGVTVSYNRIKPDELRHIYANHEVAAHTRTHPSLPTLSEAEIVTQVEDDRLALSHLSGQEVIGMAYPGGGVNHNDFVADVIKSRTNIRYARTILSTYGFAFPSDFYKWNPTVSAIDPAATDLAKRFLESKEPGLLYIWGHSYEFDIAGGAWEAFESLCALIAGNPGIVYATNAEVYHALTGGTMRSLHKMKSAECGGRASVSGARYR